MLNGASSATSVAIQPLLAEAEVPMIILSQLPPDFPLPILFVIHLAEKEREDD